MKSRSLFLSLNLGLVALCVQTQQKRKKQHWYIKQGKVLYQTAWSRLHSGCAQFKSQSGNQLS
jgi:hypothetical protein